MDNFSIHKKEILDSVKEFDVYKSNLLSDEKHEILSIDISKKGFLIELILNLKNIDIWIQKNVFFFSKEYSQNEFKEYIFKHHLISKKEFSDLLKIESFINFFIYLVFTDVIEDRLKKLRIENKEEFIEVINLYESLILESISKIKLVDFWKTDKFRSQDKLPFEYGVDIFLIDRLFIASVFILENQISFLKNKLINNINRKEVDKLQEVNLLTNHFTIGCKEVSISHTKTNTVHIESLHKWMDFKNNDWGMNKYSTDRTQYICYLEDIPLENLKEIICDLYTIYKKDYPYSKYKDFVNSIFGFTIYDLEEFIKRDYTWLGSSPDESEFEYWYFYSHDDREFFDFGINSKHDIEYFKQYYRLVLEILNEPIQKTFKISDFSNNKKSKIALEVKKPFRDIETKELFDFILLKWERKTASKWGYLWIFIVDKNNGKLTNKTDYEEYLRVNKYLLKGKPNYESCISDKVYKELEELLYEFKKSKI